jgi:hypothetical protein
MGTVPAGTPACLPAGPPRRAKTTCPEREKGPSFLCAPNGTYLSTSSPTARYSGDASVFDPEAAEGSSARAPRGPVSPLRWQLQFGPDGIHMTAAGNRVLADHLSTAFAALPSAAGG